MPIVSKYSQQQFDAMTNDLIAVLEKHKAPADLSLMVLGHVTSNVINSSLSSAQRPAITEKFVAALTAAVNAKRN
ncbi:MAG: DUF1414 domain-containing protein [Aeromonas sp.]